MTIMFDLQIKLQ